MPGVRFFTCLDCATVVADVATPPQCARCDGTRFNELASEPDPYFLPDAE